MYSVNCRDSLRGILPSYQSGEIIGSATFLSPSFSFRLCTFLGCILFQKEARKSQLEHFLHTYVLEQTLRTVDLKYQPPPLNSPAYEHYSCERPQTEGKEREIERAAVRRMGMGRKVGDGGNGGVPPLFHDRITTLGARRLGGGCTLGNRTRACVPCVGPSFAPHAIVMCQCVVAAFLSSYRERVA